MAAEAALPPPPLPLELFCRSCGEVSAELSVASQEAPFKEGREAGAGES